MSRLGIRKRLFLVVVATVAVAMALIIAGFNVLLAHHLASDGDRLLRARATAQLGLLDVRNGRLVVAEAPADEAGDAGAWILSPTGRVLEAPRTGAAVTKAARRLAARAPAFADASDTRLYAAPVVRRGRRLGTVVVSISQEPYEESRQTALVDSLALGGAALLVVALAARWLLASSFRPVTRMTRLAAAWSEHDPDHRFALGEPRDEVTELAATLDGLLDRLEASLRREQRFSAELSHELRTPLARIVAEAELALRRPRASDEYRAALELVHANALQLSRTIDALVAAARHESGFERGTADALAVARRAADACAGLAGERAIDLVVEEPPREIRLGIAGDLAERVLQPVIENACRYGRSGVRVTLARTAEGVTYEVADDGPGVADEDRERIFEPGGRGLAGRANGAGAGLGLALARRLARGVTGDVVVAPAASGGRFVVRLPAA